MILSLEIILDSTIPVFIMYINIFGFKVKVMIILF